MIPLFTQFLRLNIKKAASISIGVIPTVMIPMLALYGSYNAPASGFQWQIGYLLPTLFFPLVAGLLFAAPLGVSIGQKVSSKYLRIIFAILIFILRIPSYIIILYLKKFKTLNFDTQSLL